MRWISKLAGSLHILFCIYTLLVYALCYWPVSPHWVAGFLTMSLPVVMLIHLFVIVSGVLLGARQLAGRSLVMLLISFPFWSRTFRLGDNREGSDENIRLLSYNIHQLGVGVKVQGEKSLISPEGIGWLKDLNPDIMCFQEAYQSAGRDKDLAEALKKIGYSQFVIVDQPVNRKPGTTKTGLAVFSRYKLRNAELKVFAGQNGMLKCDVIAGGDTLTVINVHLHSMTLNLRELVEQRQMDGLKKESKRTVSRIKNGFEKRNDQIRSLEEWIEQARHPVIVCGDFNETPYSYGYGRISKLLMNSFEAGGSGFGFTFRNLPYFIRIDNQFYDPDKIELAAFKTLRGVNFSDHRPLVSDYVVKDSSDPE